LNMKQYLLDQQRPRLVDTRVRPGKVPTASIHCKGSVDSWRVIPAETIPPGNTEVVKVVKNEPGGAEAADELGAEVMDWRCTRPADAPAATADKSRTG
jgi:hypothetical protein